VTTAELWQYRLYLASAAVADQPRWVHWTGPGCMRQCQNGTASISGWRQLQSLALWTVLQHGSSDSFVAAGGTSGSAAARSGCRASRLLQSGPLHNPLSVCCHPAAAAAVGSQGAPRRSSYRSSAASAAGPSGAVAVGAFRGNGRGRGRRCQWPMAMAMGMILMELMQDTRPMAIPSGSVHEGVGRGPRGRGRFVPGRVAGPSMQGLPSGQPGGGSGLQVETGPRQ